jgi:hypothetical protein
MPSFVEATPRATAGSQWIPWGDVYGQYPNTTSQDMQVRRTTAGWIAARGGPAPPPAGGTCPGTPRRRPLRVGASRVPPCTRR